MVEAAPAGLNLIVCKYIQDNQNGITSSMESKKFSEGTGVLHPARSTVVSQRLPAMLLQSRALLF